MSGPKDMDWQLSEEQRALREAERQRRLEEERQRREAERLRRLEEELKRSLLKDINKQRQVIKNTLNNKSLEVEKYIKKYQSMDADEKLINELNNCLKYISDNVNKLISEDTVNEVEALKSYLSKLKDYDFKEENLELEKLKTGIKNQVKDLKSSDLISKINALDSDFEVNTAANSNEDDEQKLNDTYCEFKELFDRYNNSRFIRDKQKLRIQNYEVSSLMEDSTIDNEYKIEQINFFMRSIYGQEESYIKEENKNKNLYESYLKEYSLYEILCEKAEEDIKFKEDIEINDIERLTNSIREENVRLNKEIAEKEDYNYVVGSVNEVMKELGYDILSTEVVHRVNRDIVDNIYKFDDENVLNIYTSDNGTMMFEVSGIGSEKRELSSLEKLKMKESMDEFCTKYNIIKEKLYKKGIVFNNERLRPADIKYSKVRKVSEDRLKKRKNVVRKNEEKRYLN